MAYALFFRARVGCLGRHVCGLLGRCRKVLLISNFGASLLLGRVAPLDYSDASGGNVLDLRRRCWSPEILAAFEKDAPNIAVLLPDVVASDQILGRLSPYLVERFGFHPSTLVLPWAGDNADSLLGVGVFDPKRCVRVISKGTSETEFCLLPPGTYCDPTGAGSVFAAVTEAQQNMGINTRRNATLALEAVKHRHRIANWDEFSECLHRTPPANHGKYMIGLFRPEIVPRTSVPIVEYHGGLTNEQTDAEVRAIVESTAMIRQIHNCWMGPPAALYLATGGGSVNREILQVEADVAGVSFFMPTTGDSVVNGGCIRAMHSVAPMTYTWEYLTARHCEPGTEIKPQSSGVYGDLKRMFEVSLDQALALHGRSTS
jgi:xylulokinase